MIVPNILHRPQATDKKTNPGKAPMLHQLRVNLRHLLLANFLKIFVFKHKNHRCAIEKNNKWKNKIKLLNRHIEYIVIWH